MDNSVGLVEASGERAIAETSLVCLQRVLRERLFDSYLQEVWQIP